MEFLKNILDQELYTKLEEQVNKHNEQNKEKPIKLANLGGGEYVSTSKFTALETENAGHKAQLETINGELTTLKNKKTTDPDTKTAIDTLQNKYDTDTATLKDQIAKAKFDGAFNAAIAGCQAKNPKSVAALFDMEKIKYENDTLTGFTEQIENIKKENDYLFTSSGAWGARHGGVQADRVGVEAAFASLNPELDID